MFRLCEIVYKSLLLKAACEVASRPSPFLASALPAISELQVFKIAPNLAQEGQELVALFTVQILNREFCKALALAMECSVDGVSCMGQLKPDTSPIFLLILLYTQ